MNSINKMMQKVEETLSVVGILVVHPCGDPGAWFRNRGEGTVKPQRSCAQYQQDDAESRGNLVCDTYTGGSSMGRVGGLGDRSVGERSTQYLNKFVNSINKMTQKVEETSSGVVLLMDPLPWVV